jgi:FHA domain-containing protein
MERVETLQRDKRTLSRAEFEKKHPHPWLIRELDQDERPARFRTMVSGVRKAPSATARAARPGGALAQALGADPDRYGLYPLLKRGSNPWSDRVLVGRSSNNDVVLPNDRISKHHAYFQLGPRGVWRLCDARSANGTRLDGQLVPPGEDGLPVRSGQVVTFGTTPCEVIDSGELYEVL